MSILLVAIGGFLGSITRFHIASLANKRLIGTWIANITGSILLAWLLRFHITGSISDWIWLFAGIGFCGSYTTFSTFGNETLNLIIDGQYRAAVSYVSSSLVVSLLFVFIILQV
ncbi:CrcB protein [Virgibacillus halotolerans]|uniref:fluoride efflux transporter FluC n=1 Tax=Virgibacillus halotolerans TaxID=1071053 RepID=UPI001960A95D|nr:CrcB family protein [Virgibacillus halotolerans]MBM7600637.1 CrcB protein [Virgibacillus halotolerans]